MALTMVAAYDVVEDASRIKLAALLQVYGDRIQKSVFLLSLDENELQELLAKIQDIIDPATDSVWFTRQCLDCWQKTISLGQNELTEPALYWAVW